MEDKDSYPNNPPMSKVFVCLCLFVLTVIAIYIRVQGVNGYYFSEDESLIVDIARAKTLQDLLHFSLHEAHPPLFYIVLHYWLAISDSVVFARYLPLLFGLAMVPLYYRIGKLLNDELTGLCCATLITFSYGVIIQSSIVRNYSMLALLLSAAFYAYLLWSKNKNKSGILAGYIFFSVLASLTHFSAIFAIFSIAAYEAILSWRRKDSLRGQVQWVLANIFIAAVAVSAYYFWVSNGLVLGNYFSTESFLELALAVLSNPVRAIEYVLPSPYLIPILVFILCLPSISADKKLRQHIRLSYIPLVLGMMLMAANRYYPAGTRHGIWVLPFIIPACGWIIADGISALIRCKRIGINTAILVMFLTGLALSFFQERFDDRSEYQLKETTRQEILNYLKTLGPKTLFIAEGDDAVLLVDTYSAHANNAGIVWRPYLNTHMLFSQRYRRWSTKAILAGTLQEANRYGMLDGVDTLVFMKTDWDVYPEKLAPMPYLFTCHTLDKQIISFPSFSFSDLPDGVATSEQEKKVSPVAFMSVSTKDFFDQVLAKGGRATNCLNEAANAK